MRQACCLRRWIAMSAIALSTSACMTWETQQVSPDQVISGKPAQLRITGSGGSRTIMAGPTIVGDSLVGASAESLATPAARRLATALSDVQMLEVQRVNAGRTALAVVGTGLAALMFIGIATYDGPFKDSR